jgi:GT2 family glycosyltransferase
MKSLDYPKVLVAIPTYEGKDYVFKENFEAIKTINYPNYDYVYIDNSVSPNYAVKLRRRGAVCVRVHRGDNSRQALCNAQNYAKKRALEGNYDYLMFIESDLVPKADIITRLVARQVPVVGACYYIGHKVKTLCTFFTEEKQGQGIYGTRVILPKEIPTFLGTGLRRVHGVGFGCTLIRRDVFTRFDFWYDERFSEKHSDVYFYMDLWNKGVPVFNDTSILVAHYPSKWELVKDK